MPRLARFACLPVTALVLTAGACAPKQQVRQEPVPPPAAEPVPLDDSAQDGTPDFLRLDSQEDRAAFRHWFTFLAEVQYFNAPANRPAEITDCSSLLRYAYREAMRRHDTDWASHAHLPVLPAFASIHKYAYPYTPLGASVFRRMEGPFTPPDLNNGSFTQFANVETLERFNAFRVSRDVNEAEAGDLLFFRRATGDTNASFHSMVFLASSQIAPSPLSYVIYDTGPDGAQKGEIRRLSIGALASFPDPRWRPYPTNPEFLGVFRWNILRGPT